MGHHQVVPGQGDHIPHLVQERVDLEPDKVHLEEEGEDGAQVVPQLPPVLLRGCAVAGHHRGRGGQPYKAQPGKHESFCSTVPHPTDTCSIAIRCHFE